MIINPTNIIDVLILKIEGWRIELIWGCFPNDTAITWTMVDFICFCWHIYGPPVQAAERAWFSLNYSIFHVAVAILSHQNAQCSLSTKCLHPLRKGQLNLTQFFAKTANDFITKAVYQEGKTKSVQQNYREYITSQDWLGSGVYSSWNGYSTILEFINNPNRWN